MSRQKPAWKLTPKQQKTIIIACVLVFVALIVFAEIIRPNQDAKSYTDRLNAASQPLEKCYDKLADTTKLEIYYAPDISLKTKQTDVATIRQQITTCREELATFNKTAQKLAVLRFAGYTSTYRDARVNQRQAFDVIGQSNDVLDQYQRLATFLANYYQQIDAFTTYITYVESVDTAFISPAKQQDLTKQSADLRQRAETIRTLDSPAGFENTKQKTTTTFVLAASGIDDLLRGYKQGNQTFINGAYKKLTDANTSNDALTNLPFDQLTSSYIPKQVIDLPVKVKNLLAAETE